MNASKKHQADHVLRAFRYQLLQSLDAWLSLNPGEVLWLETEEDFSVLAENKSTDFQVKSSAAAAGPARHSLHSDGVKTALSRYWDRSDEGRDPRPSLAFIANGGAARERGLSFPNDEPGLVYWGAAGRGADTAPIRQALITVFEGTAIEKWIQGSPTDDELRQRLLHRVTWMLDQADVEPLTELILDKIATTYHAQGIPVAAANAGLSRLLDLVFSTACQRDESKRRLTALELQRSIEDVALREAVAQMAGRAAGEPWQEGTNVTRLGPLGANIVDRPATVQDISAKIEGEPVVWFHGAHGVGKSTLARLIALHLGGSWLMLDLRSMTEDSKATRAAFRELIQATSRTPQLRGVIIDDLSEQALDATRNVLSALVVSLAPRGIQLFVTSAHPPSPARLAELGSSGTSAIHAPYFSRDDVRTLVTAANGPTVETIDGWVELIFIGTHSGHPLLVVAKVASLRSRGWPQDALIEDIGPFTSDAVRATRDEARRRLIAEIPSSEGRDLLRRLGCVFDRADDALALALAQREPSIPRAGDALAVLRGSWIEIMPRNDLRLSPLITDISNDVPTEDALAFKRIAAEYWLSKRTLDDRTLPLCFWNAFLGKHVTVLAALCILIEQLPSEKIVSVATHLSPLSFFRTDTSLLPEAPMVGAMLRLVQFAVVNALQDDPINAGLIARRLFVEIDEIEQEEMRLMQTSVAISIILLAEYADIPVALRLEWALRHRATTQMMSELKNEELREELGKLARDFHRDGVDVAGFLFAVTANRIRDSLAMQALIEALDALESNDRNSFINSAAISLAQSPGQFIHGGWAAEQIDDHDMSPVLQRFRQMAVTVRGWDRPDVQSEVLCACSVIIDESLGDRVSAIAVMDTAIEELGALPSLIRQKAKVLGHSDNHDAAARLLISVEDAVGVDQPLDRGLALRDGAVSAVKARLFDDALRLFRKAHEALAREGTHPALMLGLRIEIAIVLWTIADRSAALLEMADVLDAAALLDPKGSRQNERTHQLLRLAAGLFWNDLDPYSSRPIPLKQLEGLPR